MLNNKKNKIEIFSAGCKFCNNVESEVNEVISGNDTLITYNLNDKTNADEYYKAAKLYGISSLPAVVVNGELLKCCGSSSFSKEVLSVALS